MWIRTRPIVVGWAVVVPLAYLTERLLLPLMARLLAAPWLPIAELTFDALALVATGWTIGRLHRAAPISSALIFAVTLCFHDLEPLLAVNVPWLLRLAADAFRDTRYLGSLADTAAQHLFLLGSLMVGAWLGCPLRKPVSLFDASSGQS